MQLMKFMKVKGFDNIASETFTGDGVYNLNVPFTKQLFWSYELVKSLKSPVTKKQTNKQTNKQTKTNPLENELSLNKHISSHISNQ